MVWLGLLGWTGPRGWVRRGPASSPQHPWVPPPAQPPLPGASRCRGPAPAGLSPIRSGWYRPPALWQREDQWQSPKLLTGRSVATATREASRSRYLTAAPGLPANLDGSTGRSRLDGDQRSPKRPQDEPLPLALPLPLQSFLGCFLFLSPNLLFFVFSSFSRTFLLCHELWELVDASEMG